MSSSNLTYADANGAARPDRRKVQRRNPENVHDRRVLTFAAWDDDRRETDRRERERRAGAVLTAMSIEAAREERFDRALGEQRR